MGSRVLVSGVEISGVRGIGIWDLVFEGCIG